jgi:two-component system sensor histidine kinase ResE
LIGDADRLAQVFTNLLDNALKHTSAGGSVTLSASVVAEGVMITVKDSGPGIPAEDISRIFERFYQVDKSRAHAEGLGLGLAITKEIVEAHGGSVSVESQVGHGAKFRVRLPFARPDDVTVAKKKK